MVGLRKLSQGIPQYADHKIKHLVIIRKQLSVGMRLNSPATKK